MRYYPEPESDFNDAQELGALDWQLNALKMNPDYVSWGPYEDYMMSKDAGWRAPVFFDSWDDFEFTLDNLNELVNFYFCIERESKDCMVCNGSGYNPATDKIADAFYDFEKTGNRWAQSITQDEVEALVREGRLWKFMGPIYYRYDDENATWTMMDNTKERVEWIPCEKPELPSAEVVNADLHAHDAINRYILVEARARRLGVYGLCPECNGRGYRYTEPHTHLGLVLWIIHPRKGCGRGVHIKHLDRGQIPEAVEYLKTGAERNAQRFGKL